MSMTRRDFAITAAAALTTTSAIDRAQAQATSGTAQNHADHDMSSMPAHWMGSEQIAFLIYPQFTALDMVGPHHMLTSLMGATVHMVAKTLDPVVSDAGLIVSPTKTFEQCPADLDVICVPGGTSGTLAAMQDEATMRFLRDRGGRAKHVTSVCTGSLLLGAAGLLDGYEATSHWAARPLLPIFGARPVDARVVRDRNRITGGGVTAGIDFGLFLVGQLRDPEYAEAVQLIAEYAPDPPYDAGTPARAPAKVKTMIDDMFVGFIAEAETVSRTAFASRR
ncbi:MAG: DJ-1/PfpI family protein [Alphaproteobacteria bacterium]|jgi:cyclohexyl-isocyanide hydratase|nr:DJ-1/PfpI family protein [Alphaproteobacteria bacterium]